MVIGVDLSGPTNVADTAMVALHGGRVVAAQVGVGDGALLDAVERLGPTAIGLDAPLSYQPGGGDRVGDLELRQLAVAAGMWHGSVMTPTMTRMAYLTLRGVALSRALATLRPDLPVAEIHPGAAMVLAGAPVDDVRAMKRDAGARGRLVAWLRGAGAGVPDGAADSDHLLAATAVAWAAERWSAGTWSWRRPAAPPHHPHDYVA